MTLLTRVRVCSHVRDATVTPDSLHDHHILGDRPVIQFSLPFSVFPKKVSVDQLGLFGFSVVVVVFSPCFSSAWFVFLSRVLNA